jgi:ATP/maltotriose-dependent transcriptional regulator MalT
VPYEATLAAFRRGDNAEAERLALVDLDEAASTGDDAGRVDALCMLARVALRNGDLSTVESRAKQAELVADQSGGDRLKRMPIHLLAVAARMSGRYGEARALYLRSIAVNEALGEARMAAAEHRNLAYVELHDGNLDGARSLVAEARERGRDLDYPALDAYLTLDDAVLAAAAGDRKTAQALLDHAMEKFADLEIVPDPDDDAEITALRRHLDPADPAEP